MATTEPLIQSKMEEVSATLNDAPPVMSRRQPRRSTRTTHSPARSGQNAPRVDRNFGQSEGKVDGRSARVSVDDPVEDYLQEAMKPLTEDERRSWKGWCELESEPALFNYILREYGVQDVNIREVVGLEDDSLRSLPQPVYGLVFLFQYCDDEVDKDEPRPKCPNHVWFANQTTDNACATIALMNIVMNVPDINLDDRLGDFKANTLRLKPAYRGKKLSECEWMRATHNSFLRRMDILVADLALEKEAAAWKRRSKKARLKDRNTRTKKTQPDDDAGFHFIAYVPVRGTVWKLDGLQRQPTNLGEAGEDWLSVAIANICQKIGQYDDGNVQFTLSALCRSPLLSIPEQLGVSIHSIALISSVLTTALPDWQAFLETQDLDTLTGPDAAFALTAELMANCRVPDALKARIEKWRNDPTFLLQIQTELVDDQARLRNQYMEEVALVSQQTEMAEMKKRDFTPLVYQAMKTLNDKGVLREIMEAVEDAQQQKNNER